MFKAAILLSHQYNMTVDGEFIGWQIMETRGDVIDSLSNTCLAVSNEKIVGIVGPVYSREAHIIAPFANKIGIPAISYAATDPDLSDRVTYPAFYRTVPSDNTAALSIAQLFIKFNWTSCIIIYQNDAFGYGGVKAIKQTFNNNGLKVRRTVPFDISKLDIQGNLKESLISSSARIVILWAQSTYTSLILQSALDFDVLGPHFTWILSSSVPLKLFNRTFYEKLIGMLTIQPTVGDVLSKPINRTLLNAAYHIWEQIIGTEFLGVSGPIQFSTNVTNRINGTYYLAQNVQPSINSVVYVPVLEWSDTDNWKEFKGSNAIVWPGNSLVTPNGRARLSNVILRIGVTESIPFTIISSTIDEYGQRKTNLVGYVPDLINLLQNKMGFIPHIILAPSNQTYSGLVDAVANGVYDIVVADVTITAARRQKAGFSNSIFDNSLRIIMRKKMVNKVDLIAYLAPFSFSLWMMLLITSIFAAFLICLLERFENRSLRNRSLISAITMSWWYSVGTIMGYGADFQVTTAAGRLLTIGLYLLSLVLVATYTANLASDLTISKAKDIISGIDDIKNGKIPFNRIGVRIGTAGEEYYLREISGGNKNFYPLNSRQHMYDSLLNNLIDASFMDSGTAQYVTNNIYCNLTLVGSDFDESSLAIVIPKRWLYEQDLDVNILSLRESGILDDLKRKWFQISSCSGTSDIPAEEAVMKQLVASGIRSQSTNVR
ncbi:unnamed protein product [Rotaria sp. Silwood1]|nr:unnamed protein product [Rotaria sp. Silwood1]